MTKTLRFSYKNISNNKMNGVGQLVSVLKNDSELVFDLSIFFSYFFLIQKRLK